MLWNSTAVAAVACLLIAISSAEQLVFTIKDGELILPLTGFASSKDSHPTAGTYSAAPPIVTGSQSTVKVYYVGRDGNTCPEGTISAATVDNRCSYGDFIGDLKISGHEKCCFHEQQQVFLLSIPGGEKHLSAKFSLDSLSCCKEDGEVSATFVDHHLCKYGSSTLAVSPSYLTKCCWNTKAQDFHVHLEEFRPDKTWPEKDLKNFHINGTKPNSLCDLGYSLDLTEARLYANRVELDVSAHVACKPYDHSTPGTITIYLRHTETYGGTLAFPLSDIGPTINVNVYSVVNSDFSVNVRGQLTGTGILKSLNTEAFNQRVDELKQYLAWLPFCE